MFSESELTKQEFLTVQEVMATHTVAVLSDADRGVGTGTLIRLRENRFVLTAHHVIEGCEISDLRFGYKSSGSLEETGPKELGGHVPEAGERFKLKSVVPDKKADIAAILLDNDQQLRGTAKFYDATSLQRHDPEDGESIVFQGFPTDNSVQLTAQTKAVGLVAEHVRFDRSLDGLEGLPSSYDPSWQFLMKYSWQERILPRGFSGAATWQASVTEEAVWHPSLVLVGVVTDYLPKKGLLIACGIGPILSLFSKL
jgi:hypothetical protein